MEFKNFAWDLRNTRAEFKECKWNLKEKKCLEVTEFAWNIKSLVGM